MSFHLWSIGHANRGDAAALVWRLLAFEDLRVSELYEVLRLRSQVFVVEQQCLFQDMDGADDQAMHLLGVRGGELLGYARCFCRWRQVCGGQLWPRGDPPECARNESGPRADRASCHSHSSALGAAAHSYRSADAPG
jgi:hypothetical protein